MSLESRLVRSLLLGGLVFVAGSALAQDGVKGSMSRLTGMSDAAKQEYAVDVAAELADTLKQAERLMSAAEKSGDQEAIDCLQPKVVALRSLGQVATAASASVPGLIASGNTSMLDSTMRQVAVLDSRADGLLVESQGCVAGNSDALGTDNLSVEGDALADQELNTDVPETLTWTDPPEASPFL
jgi:hypothetical protein